MNRLPFLAWIAASLLPHSNAMTRDERIILRERTRDLFKHGYESYMHHAFPHDALNPLSCEGESNWGNITLTLLDAMDTLALMGHVSEFEHAVRWCTQHMSFDRNETVSLFETNIRALGGLLR